MIQRKRLHCSSCIHHKQSQLNTQHYSKRQVPLKIRTSQWGEFYYDISSQTQSVRKTSRRCLEGQAQPPRKCHKIATPVKAALKTYEKDKWRKGEKLLSEWATKLSGSWTEQNLPHSGQEWAILGENKGKSKTSRRAGADFYLKHNLKGGAVTYFCSICVQVKRESSVFPTCIAHTPLQMPIWTGGKAAFL